MDAAFFLSNGGRVDGHEQIVAAINGLRSDLDQRHSENLTSQAVTDAKVVEAIRRIDELHTAFPDGDADGHRRFHEAMISKAEARARLYEKLVEELVKKGLWALLLMVCVAVWAYVKSKLNS